VVNGYTANGGQTRVSRQRCNCCHCRLAIQSRPALCCSDQSDIDGDPAHDFAVAAVQSKGDTYALIVVARNLKAIQPRACVTDSDRGLTVMLASAGGPLPMAIQ
jgi:hypothetical protein